ISSLRIWKSAHDPGAGHVGSYATGARGNSGTVYTLEATIPNHTAGEIELFFNGLTASDDIYGAEQWGIDNVEVILERDDTSIPLYDTSFTASAWARRTAAGQEGYIFSQGKDGTANHVLHMGFRTNNSFTCAFLNDDLNSSPLPFDQEWHHYACTYDLQTRLRTIYRDGVQIAQDTAAANYQAQGPTIIGAYVDHTKNFAGDIDEVAFWRTALTAAEIGELFQKVKVEDQSVMTAILADASGANNGTLAYDNLVLRETATRLGAIVQSIKRVLTIDADKPVVCAPGQGDTDASCPPQDQYINNAQTIVVSGVAGDPTSHINLVEVKPGNSFVPASGTESWSYTWNISGLNDGEHTLPVRATDAVGHQSALFNVKIIVDRTSPAVTIDQPVNERRAQQDDQGRWFVPLSGTVNDPAAGGKPGSGVESVEVLLRKGNSGLSWQEAAVNGNKWSLDYILPQFDSSGQSVSSPSGAYPAVVRATDNLGNANAGNNPALTLSLDEDGPQVTLTNPVSATQIISTSLTLQGQVSDASAVASVEVNFTPSEQVDALSGAVLYLPFDETRATQYFADQSGSGNAAVCEPASCPTPDSNGQRDGAFTFDGTDDVLDTQGGVVELARGDFSIAAWVKTTGSSQGIVTKNDSDNVWENGEKSFYIDASGMPRFVGFGDGFISSTAKVNDGQWHHILVTWDFTSGKAGKIYVDGEDVTSTATSYNAANADNADDTLKIAEPNFQASGSDIEAPNHFKGALDELLVYNRALAANEAADLYAYGSGTWAAAALNNGSWSFTIPDGENGLEGHYQINVRGTDEFGNVTPLGSQRVWRGEIDTRPPALRFLVTIDNSGSVATTKFECLVTDYNLIQDQSCLPVSAATVPSFRRGDMTTSTYDQVDGWYAANIEDTSRLYNINAVRVYPGTVDTNVSLQACDLYNHCTIAQGTVQSAPHLPAGAEVLQPSSGTAYTTLNPITVNGDVYTDKGLQALIVMVNDTTPYARVWADGEANYSPWSFEWTPPGEGVYVFEPLFSDWNNVVLTHKMYFPLLAASTPTNTANEARATAVSSGAERAPVDEEKRLAALEFLQNGIWPQDIEDVNDLQAGTPAIIYVDLEPPTVTIDSTLLTSEHALGENIVDLSGTVHDNLPLVTVQVSIDGGAWDRAGVEDGQWRYPWYLPGAVNGQTFEVRVKATDVAGREDLVTEQVEVDIVPPVPGTITLTYTDRSGQQQPMVPGDSLNDAVSIAAAWGPASAGNGPIRYAAGFSQTDLIGDEELTFYNNPGTHTQAVAAGERWFLTIDYIDDVDNVSRYTAGPFIIKGTG
ncbi:MAG: LamG-like jellyroll fold domain-containing protein, partial [Candidatus Promineifilaceae bacterium]|nr:LamG-like jellyroll fold domain-containing protein [Candidatus Promineifilaceae bacterium]